MAAQHKGMHHLAQVVGVAVCRRSGGQLATTIVAIFLPLFSFALPHLIFSSRECSNQKTYLTKDDRSAQKSRVDPFQKPVGHFGF